MTAKHVRLVSEERVYAEGHLLQSQIDFINAIERLKNYKKLRQEEVTKKIELKNKISELLVDLENFEKLLPKVAFKEEKKIEKIENKDQVKTHKERFELEDEIEEIRRKIRSLQNEY